jgi:N-methylhydantoinase B
VRETSGAMPDPFVLEIVRHRLDTINDDAAAILMQVSGSQIAVEANDLNTVIMAADGRVVACGRYVLVQVASMHLFVRHLLEEYGDNPGIAPGDQFLTNDPYVGTLHQPDVVVVAPVFAGDRLIAWCGSAIHEADVGGPTPGGMSYDAASIFDEAIPMAPVRIVEAGKLRRDIEREYLVRSRTPELNRLDLAGQLAANRATSDELLRLCERYGTATIAASLDRLLASAEDEFRDRLRRLPDGRWRHTAYVEYRPRGLPAGDLEPIFAIRLLCEKTGDRLVFDFRESDPQAPGAINTTEPALINFAMAATLLYFCGGLSWVPGGVWPSLEIRSTPGTIVHATWPAGVAMSTAATCQAIRICINAVAARMFDASDELCGEVMASCQAAGGGGGIVSGVDEAGRPFATMTLDELTGGGGGRAWADGADSSGYTTSPGAACANVEVNESYLPLLYLRRAELADSGGPGVHRGGVGALHLLRTHHAGSRVQVLSFGQGLQHPAAIGVAGGEPGASSGFALLDEGAAIDRDASGLRDVPMPVGGMSFGDGDVWLAVTQGGGGHGDPLQRDPRAVAADASAGLVSIDGAARDYGVVLRAAGHGFEVDEAASDAHRRERRRDRLGREPSRPLRPTARGARVSSGVRGDDGRLWCAACGGDLGIAGGDLYDVLHCEERAVEHRAVHRLRYPGSERFVLRHFHCPHCATQLDVQIGRRDEPPVRAIDVVAPVVTVGPSP